EIAAENIEEPYTIELLEVTDNVQYNDVVENKEAYANFAQHEPFMEQYNEANDGHLVSLQTIYDPIVGFYSPVYDSIDDIEDGAEIAIPSDVSNETRALLVLADQGLIEVDENVDPALITLDDITENPRNFEFTSVDLLNLTATYEDGAEIAIPSDVSNETRELLVLADQGLIEVDENVDPALITLDDITENPRNFEFTSVDLLNLTATYEDGVDLVFNLPTYIANIG